MKKALPGLAIVLLVFLAYGSALRAGFVWDDDKYVTDNPMLTAPDGLKQIWFSTHTQSQYFPLVYSTLRVERTLWGLNPAGYHLVNILLHGLNAVLVWVLLRRLAVPGAWLAAAIFALHPVQVETVAWVAELKNLESWFFCLWALLAWLKVVEASPEVAKDAFHRVPIPPAGQGRGGTRPYRVEAVSGLWTWYLLALTAYLLALFAKTTACTLPAALVLVVWLKGQRLTWHRAAQIVPFVPLGLAMGLVSIWWEGNLGTHNQGMGLSFTFLERVLIAGRALWFYAGKLLWPVNLAFSYPRWEINAGSPAQYLPVAGCGMAAVALWVWRRRLGPGVIAGVLFFVASLAPLLGFISNYTFQYLVRGGPLPIRRVGWVDRRICRGHSRTVEERPPPRLNAPCAQLGRDAFHRVPNFPWNEWDAVERVLTIPGDRLRGRPHAAAAAEAVSSAPAGGFGLPHLAALRRISELGDALAGYAGQESELVDGAPQPGHGFARAG